ncbi:MAG: ice-binding family protein [Bacteroidota bacterium]|nr:ice-binding family protein [Bacteroidota bacterium]
MKNKLLLFVMAFILFTFPKANYAQAPNLGRDTSFVLFTSGGAFHCTGASYVTGDIGTFVGAYTGFPPGTLVGTAHIADSTAFYAKADLGVAYDYMSGLTCDTVIGVTMGNGQVLTPRVYCIGAAATINGNLILNGMGNPNSVFIIKIDGALATSVGAHVVLTNSAAYCNVYWQVNGLFHLTDSSVFMGNIIGNGAISMDTATTFYGRGLTRAGAINIATVTATKPSGCNNCAPNITTAPVNQSACLGGSVSFTVVATGTALTYQWRKGTVNILGATNATLTINPVTLANAATNYNVVITGSCLPASTSSNYSLTINAAPVIVTAPVNISVCSGNSTGFSVGATGTGLTYQWRKGTVNLTNTANISGATSAALTINPATITDVASNYNVVITGACTPAVTSSNVSLALNATPAITTAPINQTVCTGSTADFTVAASGTALVYQWRKGTVNLTNTGNITGALSATLTINPTTTTDVAGNYNVVITGACTPAVTSSNVSLSLNAAPTITTVPVNQTFCTGTSTGFAVIASGTGLTYQWRKGTVNLTNTGNITGALSASLTINPATVSDVASNYNVVITGTCTPAVTSSNVSLTLNAAPTITTVSVSQTVCTGTSAGFAVVASGTALTYQWRKGTLNLINTGNITGALSASLTINPATISDAASDYNVVISGTCTPVSTSSNVSLTINTAPAITIAPVNQTACAGSTATFNVSASGSGLTYQWRKGTVNLTNTGNISGATTASLIINPVSVTDVVTNYNVVISGTCSPAITSSFISLALNTAPGITTAPVSQTACYGNPASFSVAATGTGLTYQWRIGTANIAGATSAIYTISNVTLSDVASNYNVVISGTCSPASTSSNVSLTVNTVPDITTAPVNQLACVGSSASFSVVANGTALTYQWRIGTVNISGATSSTLTINPVSLSDAASNYNVVINGTCSPASTSSNVSLTVNTAPGIVTAPVSQTACAGSSAAFTVVATGTALTYQWRNGTVNISGATSDILTINPVTLSDAGSNYNVVISGTCSPSYTSSNVTLSVNTAPVLTSGPITNAVCIGGSESFTVTATGTGLTYQWRKGTVNLSNTGNISGANTASLTINPVALTDVASNYNVVITGTCSPDITSADIALILNTAPGITSAPVNTSACAGTLASFSVAATGTGLSYQWRRGLVNISNGANISGATSATLTINPVKAGDHGADYNVVISGTCLPGQTSMNVSLIVNEGPIIVAGPNNNSGCIGGSESFWVIASGTGLTYQWRRGTVNLSNTGRISGANTSILTVDSVNSTDVGSNYNVVVTGACAPIALSKNASLEICVINGIAAIDFGNTTQVVAIYPNPFTTSINVIINDASNINTAEFRIYNALGAEVMKSTITKQLSILETSKLPAGNYFYKVSFNDKIVQTGKLITL